MSILVTGATGFIGRRLVKALLTEQTSMIAVTREPASVSRLWPGAAVEARRADFDRLESLGGLCRGVDTVLHLAGCADAEDPAAEARVHHAIVGGTEALFAEAAAAGVRRFVFVSSVKAMGEGGEQCQDEATVERPATPYGRAKLTAERAVLEAGRRHGVHASVLRLPLVYGPGNRGNIPRMIVAVDKGVFPPLADNGNRRSMVHVDDAARAVLLAAEQAAADRQTYIVTDAQAYSTRRIYDMIRAALGMAPRRWGVPAAMLRAAGAAGDVIGRVRGAGFALDSGVVEKLVGSAWYSSDKIARELGFRPAFTLPDALPGMVAEYRGQGGCVQEKPPG